MKSHENVIDDITKAKVLRGIADMEAGRVRPADEVFAEIRERCQRENVSRIYDYTGRN